MSSSTQHKTYSCDQVEDRDQTELDADKLSLRSEGDISEGEFLNMNSSPNISSCGKKLLILNIKISLSLMQ